MHLFISVQFTVRMFRPWLGHHQGYGRNICRVNWTEIKRRIRWLKKLKANVKMHGEHNVKLICNGCFFRWIWSLLFIVCFKVTARNASLFSDGRIYWRNYLAVGWRAVFHVPVICFYRHGLISCGANQIFSYPLGAGCLKLLEHQ
jgi:hypothetical protein